MHYNSGTNKFRWKNKNSPIRTLEEAVKGADVFISLSPEINSDLAIMLL
ncbi:MAG: hypothetical protein ACFIN5_00015 [Candidatus Walczuchella monophlebidarum]